MSKLETISQFIHRFSQFIMLGLLSAVLYFVRDIHEDIKTTHTKVEHHETKLEVHDTKINFLTGRVDAISEHCWKQGR